MNNDQKDAVRALELVSDICERHGIDYYLLAGSCLGGVRHKGMIPWDDDIDIGVPNEQYDQLKAAIEKELPAPYVWRNECGDYPRFYGKIVKDHIACVDVFRLVKFPDCEMQRWYIWIARKLLFRAINIKYYQREHVFSKHFFTNPITSLMGKMMSYKDMNSIMRRIEEYSANHPDRYRINLHSVYSMRKEMIPGEWLDEKSSIEFENRSYPTVANPDEYLTHLYGDYMTPPPEAERNIKRHPERFL